MPRPGREYSSGSQEKARKALAFRTACLQMKRGIVWAVRGLEVVQRGGLANVGVAVHGHSGVRSTGVSACQSAKGMSGAMYASQVLTEESWRYRCLYRQLFSA